MTTVRKIAYPAGSHICALYNHPQEQLATAVEYIRAGLERGERCLYICGEISKDDFRKALIASGIDAEREEKRGALIFSDKHSGYLPNGIFDPDGMITMLRRAVQDALDAGFSGLCGGGDMIWLLERAPGSDRLTEYEAQLNDFYRTHKARGLCFYNRSSLPAEVVDHSLATHKQVLLEGTVLLDNPYHEPDDRAMRRKAADPEIVAEKLDVLDATRIALQG